MLSGAEQKDFRLLLDALSPEIRGKVLEITLEGSHAIIRLPESVSTCDFDYSAFRLETEFSLEFVLVGGDTLTRSEVVRLMQSQYPHLKLYYFQNTLCVVSLDYCFSAVEKSILLEKSGWSLSYKRLHSDLSKDLIKSLSHVDVDRSTKLNQIGLSILHSKSCSPLARYKLSAAGGCSNYYLKIEGSTIMLDAGIKPSAFGPILPVLTLAAAKLAEVSAIVISHSHVDHAGFLASILELAYDGPLYMTRPTLELCIRVMSDCIKLNPGSVTKLSLEKLITNTIITSYNTKVTILRGTQLLLSRVNHVIGASAVCISHNRFKFLFTGDFKYALNSKELQSVLKPVDNEIFRRQYNTVLTEATLCNRLESWNPVEEQRRLVDIIKSCNTSQMNLIIPCFSSGRQYMVMTVLRVLEILKSKGQLNSKLYIDRLVYQSLLHHLDYPELINNQDLYRTNQYIKLHNEPLKTDEKFVIIASSGMCEGGPIKSILPYYLGREDSAILFTGYQAKDSLGDQLLRGLREYQVEPGVRIEIKIKIHRVSVGRGHTTYPNLFQFWNRLNIKQRLLFTHGEATGLNSICAEWNRLHGGLSPVGCAPFTGDQILLSTENRHYLQ
jgi:predicted metal-dependent RNase